MPDDFDYEQWNYDKQASKKWEEEKINQDNNIDDEFDFYNDNYDYQNEEYFYDFWDDV